jgi:excisionase family DNA binding protein
MIRFKRNKRNAMSATSEKTSHTDQKIAKASFEALINERNSYRSFKKNKVKLVFQETKNSLELPEKAVQLLKEILLLISEGKEITIIPTDAELSTQEAADILQVSRPHVVKLLKEGKIPYHKTGSHRRISQQDLTTYELALKSTRKASLDYLAKQAQEENLGY